MELHGHIRQTTSVSGSPYGDMVALKKSDARKITHDVYPEWEGEPYVDTDGFQRTVKRSLLLAKAQRRTVRNTTTLPSLRSNEVGPWPAAASLCARTKTRAGSD